MVMRLFGSKKEEQPKQAPPPQPLDKDQQKEMQRDIKRKLNKEVREVEKQIFHLEMMKKKTETDLKKAKDKGDKYSMVMYAKQIVQANKTKEKYLMNKAKIISVQHAIDTQFASIKMTQIMGKSAEIMKTMGQLMNVKEMSATMQDVSKQMIQMGLIDEMVQDALDMGTEDIDENDVDEEVDAIINQVVGDTDKKKNDFKIPADAQKNAVQNKDNDLDELEKRMKQL